MSEYVALITALVAVGGLGATVWKQISDQSLQRERDRDQRKLESDRRQEDRFAAILSELGSEAPAAKAGAASSLITYLGSEHRRFHHQVRIAALTNLKLDHEEPIRKLLARVYVAALRSRDEVDEFERDLSRAKLANTDLSGASLSGADLAFADLSHSTLLRSDLFRARGYKVVLEGARLCSTDMRLIEVRFGEGRCQGADFSNAKLINAHLENADLRGARFHRCRLQAAHFEGANLAGAEFYQANLADTYFLGAELDFDCARSIIRADNWRQAHFDPGDREWLEEAERAEE